MTSDELYGYMTLAKEWKDGVLSIIMRNMSKEWPPFGLHQNFKWVILDGDIDAVWIESMNTVMDDNKVSRRLSTTSPGVVSRSVDASKTPLSRSGLLLLFVARVVVSISSVSRTRLFR